MLVHRKKHTNYEGMFEDCFRDFAAIFKCFYCKIPDAIITKDCFVIKKDGTKSMKEYKRPYDGNLITSVFNYAIELKYNNGTLKEHQYDNGKLIHQINGSFFVIRKIDKTLDFYKKGIKPVDAIKYRVETYEGKHVIVFDKIDDLFRWFIKERRDSRKL